MTLPLQSDIRVEGVDKPMSRLVLGTAFYNAANKDAWFAILDAFRAQGGTVLDSGRVYGDSEVVLGAWLADRDCREEVVLITKCGHGTDHRIPEDTFEQMVADELNISLTNLGTDYVDLYMLHRDNEVMPVGRIMERMHQEVTAGRVRTLGASNWRYDRIDAANAYARKHGLTPFTAVSNNLSLAQPADAFYPGLVSTDPAGEKWHWNTNVPLFPWSAQARGFFTGRYSPDLLDSPPPENDPFLRRMIEVYCNEANFERLRRTESLGKERGYTAVEVALAWLLHKPFPMAPIIGPHTPDELNSCLKALTLQLTPEECQWLEGE